MVGMKLSAQAQIKLGVLEEARRKMDRIYALVEQYGGQSSGEGMYLSQITRAATDVARVFMNSGYGVMADSTKQIGMLAKRSGSKPSQLRTMRELVVSIRQAMEHAQKMIMEEEKGGHQGPAAE